MILTITLNPCIDQAVFVSQFKPHDANRVERVERDAGGKGINLSRIVAELGGSTMATGFLGGSTGYAVRKVLDDQGAIHRFVEVRGETRINFSVEDDSEEPPTTFNARGPEISEEELDALRSLLPELLYATRWITVGGSMPPGVPTGFYAEIIRFAREHGVRVMVDADGPAMLQALEEKPDLVKPNVHEASRLIGKPIETLEHAVDASREILRRLEPASPIAIVSRGEKGAVLACNQGVFHALPVDVEVRSTIGCGDSLLGGLIWSLENGGSIEEAFALGVACGTATAMTSGSEIGRKPMIETILPSVRIERL